MFGKKDPFKSPRETGGPVVKSGPTRGQNRSRNQDGEWRKKRSDSGSGRKKSGCFFTTAACTYKGLPDDCHELQTLRVFRDTVLMSSAEGRDLVQRYYEVAPSIVERLTDKSDLDDVWRSVQKCVIAISENRHKEAVEIYREMVQRFLNQGLSSCTQPTAPEGRYAGKPASRP